MICKSCGGLVTWQGLTSNLTHTKCHDCGAINNQQPEEEREDLCEVCTASVPMSELRCVNDLMICDSEHCEYEATHFPDSISYDDY